MSPSQPDLRGSWAGLTWSHTAGHLYRAVLEGVALEYCVYRDVLQAVNPELSIREVRITGGGDRSALWNQIKADALGIPVVQIDRHEGAPLGVAMLAGYGVGLFESIWMPRRPGGSTQANHAARRENWPHTTRHVSPATRGSWNACNSGRSRPGD